jgi:hypothetical protein
MVCALCRTQVVKIKKLHMGFEVFTVMKFHVVFWVMPPFIV